MVLIVHNCSGKKERKKKVILSVFEIKKIWKICSWMKFAKCFWDRCNWWFLGVVLKVVRSRFYGFCLCLLFFEVWDVYGDLLDLNCLAIANNCQCRRAKDIKIPQLNLNDTKYSKRIQIFNNLDIPP